ncbi:monooxygenase [Gallaecimonas sp. GXIMD4217]|uniref:monooxygenase n=1 Tax=Gallaecimonas sp. GXIMD4217 TaxID=3131927 RepID=UPI00311B0A51
MTKLLQIHFPYPGPFGKEMTEQLTGLAESIRDEPGFLWKIWTQNEGEQEAGGIYLFEDEAAARAYLEKHTARLKALGVPEVQARIFDVNDELTRLTSGPVGI